MTIKEACITGDLEAVKRLATKDTFKQALEWASHYDRLDIVKYAVEQGASHSDKGTALRTACMVDNFEIVKYLIEEAGANLHTFNDYAFRWSSKNGHLRLVKYLLEAGANLHAMYDEAFRTEHEEVLEYLKTRVRLETLEDI